MAYTRNSVHNMFSDAKSPNSRKSASLIDMEVSDIPNIEDSPKEKRVDFDRDKLIIFSVDISNLSSSIQYIILATGLLFFMCLYGYFQELVVYGWFDRKLSIFSTFLHFLGCSIFAEVQRKFTKPPSINSQIGPPQQYTPAMGNANSRVAIFYYLFLVFLKTSSQWLTNLSMTQINYPAKVLFKSANPLITMIIGLLWFGKSYPLRDYGVVLLLIIGLYLFIINDATAQPEGTGFGIFLVSLSMFGSAGVPMIQEHCMIKYNASIEELLYYSFVGSTIMSLLLAILNGELFEGVLFLTSKGTWETWTIFTLFCSVGFFGANFSTGLTQRFGSLVNGITNTARKAVTLVLSFLLFPDRNTLTTHHLIGASVFFCGLLLRAIVKDQTHSHTESKLRKCESVSSLSDVTVLAAHHALTSRDGQLVDIESQIK